MPSIPTYTKCASLGCKSTKSKLNSYCMKHGGKDWINTEDRKEFNFIYQTPFWKNKRLQQLSINPLCQACLKIGRVTQANHVDHVFAWNALGKDAFYNNLFQSLCHECHSYKTGLEKQGIYRCYISDTKDYALHEYKFVLGSTPSHASNVL